MRQRTNIDVDFQGFAAAIERTQLAKVAKGVSMLAAAHGNRVTGLKLGKPQGWISKMRTIAKAVDLPGSVAGLLVVRGGVRDVEIAYYVALIERKSRQKAREVAANIANETRQSVKRIYATLKPSR